MARWLLFAVGVVGLMVATAIYMSIGVASQGFAVAIGAFALALLLSSAFGRPYWVISLVVVIFDA